ncbi:hypothetical protein PENSPDRAFT_555549, partial [Peniophora sp. CONT]
MIYLGVAPGNLNNWLFMRLPNNVLFTSTQAIFDEKLFPRDKDSMAARHRPAELPIPRRKKTPKRSSPPTVVDDDNDFPSHPPNGPSQRRPDSPDDDQDSPTQLRTPSPRRSSPSPPPQPREQTPEEPEGPRQPVPEPSSALPPSRDSAEDPGQDEAHLAKLCREGGVKLMNFLVAQAIPDEGQRQPNVKNYRELTWRDVKRLPQAEQEKIKAAMRDEMEAHRK